MSWTPETLKDYVDREFHCQRDMVAHALDTSKTATAKAEHELTLWKASQNEWRKTVTDLVAMTMTRKEWDDAHKRLLADTETLRRQFESHLADYMGNRAAWTRMMTLAGVVAAVFGTLSGAMVAILHYLNAPK